MKLLLTSVALAGLSITTTAQMLSAPIAGEIRAFAVDTTDRAAMLELHRAGWLEAAGQVLSTSDFSLAYRMIRRTWTSRKVPADRFAVPDLRRMSRSPGEIDERTAQMLGGDLVTSGRPPLVVPRLLYCVYVGVDTSELDGKTGRLTPAR